MVDKKDKELTDKDLEKATGGTGPTLKHKHIAQPGSPRVYLDDPDTATTPRTPKKRPGDQVNPG